MSIVVQHLLTPGTVVKRQVTFALKRLRLIEVEDTSTGVNYYTVLRRFTLADEWKAVYKRITKQELDALKLDIPECWTEGV